MTPNKYFQIDNQTQQLTKKKKANQRNKFCNYKIIFMIPSLFSYFFLVYKLSFDKIFKKIFKKFMKIFKLKKKQSKWAKQFKLQEKIFTKSIIQVAIV